MSARLQKVTTSARLNCDGFITNEDKESRCVSGLRDKDRKLRDIDRLKNFLLIQNKKTTPTYKNYIIHSTVERRLYWILIRLLSDIPCIRYSVRMRSLWFAGRRFRWVWLWFGWVWLWVVSSAHLVSTASRVIVRLDSFSSCVSLGHHRLMLSFTCL